MRKVKVRIIATGEIKTVKSYSTGYIDSVGNFYHRTKVEFLEVAQ